MRLESAWALSLAALGTGTARLPAPIRYSLARRLARASRWYMRSRWQAVESNLKIINAWAGAQYTPRQVFENFSATLSDFVSHPPLEVRVTGREKAEAAKASGHGCVLVTSHLGHWELGGRLLSDWGWKVTAVYQPYESEFMKRFIQKRRAPGLRYLAVGRGAALGAARVLNKKETVAFLGDRPFGEEGALVPLCGRLARLPRGPFQFACRYGAPVIPGFVLQEGNGRYHAVVEDPLWPGGKTEKDITHLMRQAAQVLEKYLGRYGDQWFSFDRVWE